MQFVVCLINLKLEFLQIDDEKVQTIKFLQDFKEATADFKDHMIDGHRGSIASITERPPYRPIPKDKTNEN